ncbi:MAG: hypothetical protein AAGK09_09735 [Planctomycetota bacterium]
MEPSAIPDPPANRREAVMEDRRTQHTLDALADLYLTGVPNDPIEIDPSATPTTGAAPSDATATPPNSEAATPPAALPPVAPATPPTAVPATPVGNLAQHPLHGPPPFKLHPRPAAKAAPGEPGLSPPPAISPKPSPEPFPAPPAQPTAPALTDAFDTLDPEPLSDAETAALLGDASSFPPHKNDAPPPTDVAPTPPPNVDHDLDPGPTPAPAAPGPLTVMTEAVVVGNLPGPSGAWVSQYAQSLAEQEGPVVLVHLDRHEADFELVRPRGDAPEPRDATPRRPLNAASTDQPAPPADPIALLDHAIHHPDHPARSVLVRIDPSTDLDDLARLADLDAWTLATGPDEFATAAAVQLVDRLLTAYPEAADTALGLMVLGADQPAAIDAANRVAGQLGPRLAHPVELLGYQKQMLPVRISQLGRAPADAHTWTRLLDWLEQHAPPEPDDARPQPAPRTTFLPAEPSQPIDEPDAPATEEPQPAHTIEAEPQPQQPAVAPPPSVEPTPAPPVATHNASLDTIESRRDTIRRRWLDRLTPTPTRTAPPDGTPAAEAAEPPAQPAAAEPTPPAEPLAATPAAPIVAPEPTPEPEPVPAPTSVEPIAEEPAATAAPAPPPEPPPAKPRRARPTRPALDAATPPRATQPPPITPRVAPTPTPTPTPVPTAATTDIAAPDLAQLLADRDAAYAGSITLEAACPRHPDTEVILDQTGQLHLLARHDSTDPAPDAPDLDAALIGLLETRQWAIDHLDLIALTQRQARFDRTTAPDIHLFTDDARAATRLADRVGPMLHLHLLQPVAVGQETTWFCTPLT